MFCRLSPLLFLVLSACAVPGSAEYYLRWDADLRAAGRLRADRAPRDAPFSNADLAANFARIGFGSEFEIVDGRYVALPLDAEAPLARWEGPIRYAMFGAAGAQDRRHVAGLTARLSRLTGLPITEDPAAANLLVFFLDTHGRKEIRRIFAERPDYEPLRSLYETWAGDADWPCAAEFYYRPPADPAAWNIYFAVVYIRDEVQGLSRRSCIEEEIAQTMGLARDDASLRPSIFNDDEEFALMTEHDALLLRLLYDHRLRPGMTAEQAMPLVRRAIAEMRPEG